MATKKKTVAKKAAPAKAKPIKKAAPAKKPAASKAKPAPKKAPVSKVAKPAPKKVVPAKKAPAKPVAKKAVAKPVAKPAAKPAAKKPVVKAAAVKKAVIPAKKTPAPAKKAPTPAPVKKAAPVKAAPAPVAKAPVQKPAAPTAPAAPIKAIKPAVKSPAPSGIKASAKNPKDIKIPQPKPVVVPKIATKTARKYQPDFTKSVLDQQKQDPGAPMTRYSDAELQEFKELIQRKLEAAKKELQYLQGLITRKDDQGGDESENRYMTMEDGSLSMEREQLSQMASRQITFIDHLEKALMRIESKTYGVCRVTGKLIDKARLKAVPHATLSIEAKMGIVK